MQKRVLVTRPEPGASETALRLAELGLEPVKLPLQETQALAVAGDAIAAEVAAIAVTSANAIRHAPRDLLQRLSALPCFAVGEATAAAAQAAGFARVLEAGGDAGTLAGMIGAKRPGGLLLYLCGRVRRPHFEQRLHDAGVAVAPVETYCTMKLVPSVEQVAAIAGREPIDAVLLYSANAAEALIETARQKGLESLFGRSAYLCLSSRIAEVLDGKVGGKVMVAVQPTETALLALIHHVGKPAP